MMKHILFPILLFPFMALGEISNERKEEIVKALENGVWVTVSGIPIDQSLVIERSNIKKISKNYDFYIVSGNKGICEGKYTILEYKCNVQRGRCSYYVSNSCISP